MTISFTVSKNGNITAQTKSADKDDHLFIFSMDRFTYVDRMRHDGYDPINANWLYTLSKRLYWKLKDKSLLSGNILSDITDFLNATTSQKNYFSKDITIVMSRLAHHQMDYSWFNEEGSGPWQRADNAKWSPIASNPDQNANISRSFDIHTNSATSGIFYLLAWTDNGMTSQTKVEGLNNISDYYYTHRGDILQCNSAEGWCKAWNESCCAISMINKGSIPTRVTMNAYTTWSDVEPSFVVAAFGDITTSNHTEAPSPGDDSNPAPLHFVLSSEQ